MGTSTSGIELARKIRTLGTAVDRSNRAGVMSAALLVKDSVKAASGQYATSKLARVGFNIVGASNPTALVRMTSRKAHLLDHDTKAHRIVPKRRRRRGSTRQAMSTPYGPRASVQHPGTKGKFMWEKGLAVAIPLSSAKFGENVTKTMLKVFG